MTKTSFHVSNFGMFGGSLPQDNDGYCHTTVKGWRDAGYNREDAREMASRAKEAVAAAEAAIDEWRAPY